MPDFNEGGGDLPPFKESFLERVVGVGWGGVGGVFVSGDECCWQRYTALPDNKSDRFQWTPLGSLAFSAGGTTQSGSYGLAKGKPTFLLGGYGYGYDRRESGCPRMMLSNDGTKWMEVGAGRVMGGTIVGLVWDKYEQRFYADPGGSQCLYSSDGLQWFYSADSFGDHCNNPLGAPDGFYGYDKSKDVVIFPNGGKATVIANASSNNAEEFDIFTGIPEVLAINFTGGIWMCGGQSNNSTYRSMTTTSLDGGHHWFYSTVGSLGMDGDYQILVMLGAPFRDFKNTKLFIPKSLPSGYTHTPVQSPRTTTSTLAVSSTLMATTESLSDAGGFKRSKLGPMASAISPSRHPGTLLRRAYRWV